MTDQALLPADLLEAANPIGAVFQVGLSTLRVFISDPDSGQQTAGVGDYVAADCGEFCAIGQMTEMNVHEQSTAPIGVIELFATLDRRNGIVTSGILRSPRLGAQVYAAPPALVQLVITSRYRKSSDNPMIIDLAHLPDAGSTPIGFAPDSLFGRHLAIVGTTGSGKSWTLGRLIEEVAKFNSKVILFDAAGEFENLPGGSMNTYVGYDPDPPEGAVEVAVPYYELRESDLYAIFKPSGRSQFPKLRMAMKSLKLARLAPHLALDGTIIKAHRMKMDFDNEYRHFSAELESPTADFDIHLLAKQMENECVNPQRSATEPMIWGGPNASDYSDCVPLMNRIQDIIRSANLAAIFQPGDRPSLFEEIRHFLTSDSCRVLRISLQYLAFEHNAREIVANAIGRHLLEIARTGFFRQQPLLLIMDEAHQFLNSSLLTGDHFPLDAFGLIAKEGRKYALNICLATQRPRDIPEGVLSQMGTLIVHRLINDYDRQLIERATSSMDHNTAASIPVLAPGDAIVIGVDFPIPLSVKVIQPACRPDSRGPDYQRFWADNG